MPTKDLRGVATQLEIALDTIDYLNKKAQVRRQKSERVLPIRYQLQLISIYHEVMSALENDGVFVE